MNTDNMAERVKYHAEAILRASGSSLKHHTIPSGRAAILSATMDCFEEGYRMGAAFAIKAKDSKDD